MAFPNRAVRVLFIRDELYYASTWGSIIFNGCPTAHRYHRSCRWLSPHALVNPARVSPALLGTRGATAALVTMGCTVVVLLEACVYAYFVTANQSLKVFPDN
uniref:Uncharacterized protein n=1 Tax=Oryza meridionalis TaxID=40149 RepID=A0A0E0E2Q3_9ORYZ